MARYFNRTRGPVTVSLRNGESAIVAPKQVLTVTPEQDRSASILSRVRKNLLVRLPDKPAAVPAPTPAVPEVQVPVKPQSQPVPVESPTMEWKKARLVEYAQAKGLEISSSWTKVEILEAIEGSE